MNPRRCDPILAPSIISSDYMHLADTVRLLEANKRCIMHVDVMDGVFVPNITIGMPIVASLRKETNICIDCHLMITNPAKYVLEFVSSGANQVSIHYEADQSCYETLSLIRKAGAKAGIAINPETSVEAITSIIDKIDFVNVMSVHPGFSGQSFISNTIDKVSSLDLLRTNLNLSFMIQVDGGINLSNATKVIEAGADILVAGNSVFTASNPLQAIDDLLIKMDAAK